MIYDFAIPVCVCVYVQYLFFDLFVCKEQENEKERLYLDIEQWTNTQSRWKREKKESRIQELNSELIWKIVILNFVRGAWKSHSHWIYMMNMNCSKQIQMST